MAKFVKGQSGNPSGRPKAADDVRDLARAHGPEAIERLVEWLRSDNAKASVSAANVLLDRGYGKAAQSVEVSGKDGGVIEYAEVSALERLRGRIDSIIARTAATEGVGKPH